MIIENYLESMIYDFNCGNDNEYDEGDLVEFRYEEIEKGDLDNYDEEDVNMFYEMRNYISEVKEIKYKSDDDGIEYIFSVEGNDIVCRFKEVSWDENRLSEFDW
jgi:hypothetical protein